MKEGKQVDCTQAVIAQQHNWLGTQDAKVDPVETKVISKMLQNMELQKASRS